MKGLENDKVIGRGRPREHPKGTSDHMTSSSRGCPTGDVRSDISYLLVTHARTPPFQGNPEGVGRRLMTSLPVKKPHLGGYCATCACAHPTLPSEPLGGHMTFDHVTSVSHVGHAQWYILYYYYSKKKVERKIRACASDHFRSCDFQFRSRDFR